MKIYTRKNLARPKLMLQPFGARKNARVMNGQIPWKTQTTPKVQTVEKWKCLRMKMRWYPNLKSTSGGNWRNETRLMKQKLYNPNKPTNDCTHILHCKMSDEFCTSVIAQICVFGLGKLKIAWKKNENRTRKFLPREKLTLNSCPARKIVRVMNGQISMKNLQHS